MRVTDTSVLELKSVQETQHIHRLQSKLNSPWSPFFKEGIVSVPTLTPLCKRGEGEIFDSNDAEIFNALQIHHTSPYLWMVVLTVIWLLIPQYLGATAIAILRTPDEIVAAADSKQTMEVLLPGFVSSRDVCKIHKIRDNFYFAVAGYRGVVDPLTGKAADTPQGGIFTVEHAVLRAHKADLSIRENVDLFRRSVASFLVKNLGERQRDNPEHFKRNFSILSRSDLVFFGIEREVMVVHHLQFRAQAEPPVRIIATRWICPGDCQDPTLAPFFLGERDAMETKYWTETRFNKDDGLPKNAAALVDAAIAANPKAVGRPIDILRITREESSWITVKPECRQ